jgi:hypothetical protein
LDWSAYVSKHRHWFRLRCKYVCLHIRTLLICWISVSKITDIRSSSRKIPLFILLHGVWANGRFIHVSYNTITMIAVFLGLFELGTLTLLWSPRGKGISLTVIHIICPISVKKECLFQLLYNHNSSNRNPCVETNPKTNIEIKKKNKKKTHQKTKTSRNRS